MAGVCAVWRGPGLREDWAKGWSLPLVVGCGSPGASPLRDSAFGSANAVARVGHVTMVVCGRVGSENGAKHRAEMVLSTYSF